MGIHKIVEETQTIIEKGCQTTILSNERWILHVARSGHNGTNFDTEIFVYSGSCSNLNCIGSDNNSGNGTTSEITFTSSIGVEYFIYVDGNGSSTGQFELSISCTNTCNANAGSWN